MSEVPESGEDKVRIAPYRSMDLLLVKAPPTGKRSTQGQGSPYWQKGLPHIKAPPTSQWVSPR